MGVGLCGDKVVFWGLVGDKVGRGDEVLVFAKGLR